MDDVSPSTRRAIHADEERGLRWAILRRSPFFIIATLLWISVGARFDNPLFFIVGLTALPVGTAALSWWRHRKTDPLTHRSNRIEDRDAAIAEQTAIAERVASRGSYVTYTLAGLLVAVGVMQLALDGSIERSVAAAGLVKPAVKAGQWWRLISATYLHGSLVHIWGNVGALLVLGRYVEAFSPRWRLPVVYAAAGVAGSLASFFLLGKTSVGASGAILGLAGYLAAMSYLRSGALPKSVRASVLATIGFAAYLGAFGFSFIDNAAHLGGLAAGALIAWLTVRREDEEPRHSNGGQPQWNLIGAAAAVLIVIGAGGTVAVLARARPRPVSSAEVSLSSAAVGDRVQTPGRTMVVTNKSDRPIEAYRVSVRRDGRRYRAFWRDDCCFTGNGAQTPIAPHESREIGTMPVVVVRRRSRSVQGVDRAASVGGRRRGFLDDRSQGRPLASTEGVCRVSDDAAGKSLEAISARVRRRHRAGDPRADRR
jgi:membrane associated rhomboid family serine protease